MEHADGDPFTEDLSGHFSAVLEHVPHLGRWRFTISDYQGNVMLSGLATSEQQASRIVCAWDDVIISTFDGNGDPSMDWPG